ncbi:hypothetical protein [Pseudomonas lactucae]|uniref:hypothetical protein n=1 Tax=Pseudomonas lactucae TaxID=2813360 RepID=UPI00313441D8
MLLTTWPQPTTSPEAVIFATETQLCLRYHTDNQAFAVIRFPLVKIFKFGSPNDEALGSHPLAALGLRPYQVNRIDRSTWITELEQQNAKHPRHDRALFLKDATHYVFTFQDSTLECVVIEGEFWPPQIQLFACEEEAKDRWFEWVKDAS